MLTHTHTPFCCLTEEKVEVDWNIGKRSIDYYFKILFSICEGSHIVITGALVEEVQEMSEPRFQMIL